MIINYAETFQFFTANNFIVYRKKRQENIKWKNWNGLNLKKRKKGKSIASLFPSMIVLQYL